MADHIGRSSPPRSFLLWLASCQGQLTERKEQRSQDELFLLPSKDNRPPPLDVDLLLLGLCLLSGRARRAELTRPGSLLSLPPQDIQLDPILGWPRALVEHR